MTKNRDHAPFKKIVIMFTKMAVSPLFNDYLIELNKAKIIIYHALKSQVFQPNHALFFTDH